MIFTEYAKGLLDVLIPRACLRCGVKLIKKSALCDNCLSFKRNFPPFCPRCGQGISAGFKTKTCPRCLRTKFYFDRNLSPFLFESPLTELIHLFKYQGFDNLGLIFSEKLALFIRSLNLRLDNYDFITSVPLHPRKLREREYNQSRILAENIGLKFGLQFFQALGVKRYLKSQVTRTYRQRQTELKDNFYLKADVSGKRLVLVDDVFTTGATVSESAKVLKENGASEVLVLTLAIRKPQYQKSDENNT
ncbi:MAG: ComF family protein [Candidatus Omnitrophica bacterium]|nr:ComF family protein [Candidatus Omnitrophota bacterium]